MLRPLGKEQRLLERAKLTVVAYLDSLMRGDIAAALSTLGLKPSASPANVTEAPILARASDFEVLETIRYRPSAAKVWVRINAPRGKYFGDYVVSMTGNGSRITQHVVIPVEGTTVRSQ
jgi:hypothetical protein